MGNEGIVTSARHELKGAERLNSDLVLGGEATIWSYETDPASLQTTAWPRASAMAERLWSDPKNNGHGFSMLRKLSTAWLPIENAWLMRVLKLRFSNQNTASAIKTPAILSLNMNSAHQLHQLRIRRSRKTFLYS